MDKFLYIEKQRARRCLLFTGLFISQLQMKSTYIYMSIWMWINCVFIIVRRDYWKTKQRKYLAIDLFERENYFFVLVYDFFSY